MTETDVIPAAASAIELIGQDGYGWIDAALNHLDYDPSVHMVEQMIGELAGVESKTQHAIGEILVFIRYRSAYHTVATFPREGNAFPDALVEFIHRHYDVSPGLDHSVEPFLAWEVHKYPKFWLLVGADDIRVWEQVHTTMLDDIEFDSYLSHLTGRLREILHGNTLYSYYRVATCFPRNRFVEGISWTSHLEITYLAAHDVPKTLTGQVRWTKLAERSQEVLAKMAEEGDVSVLRVREQQRRVAAQKRGFTWQLPLVSHVYAVETAEEGMVGEPIIALVFQHPLPPLAEEAYVSILYHMGLGRQYGRKLQLYLNGDRLELATGEVVATIPNIDDPLVDRAVSHLASKMDWLVR